MLIGPGRLVAIHLAAERGAPMHGVDRVVAEAGAGLVGDRWHGSTHRHVTVIAAHDVAAASDDLGAAIPPGATRRNLTIDGVDVPTRPDARLWIGEAELQVVRAAAPCARMDEEIGHGAKRALHGRGGAVCRVLVGASTRVGASVEVDVAVRAVANGSVQGVFFRASTVEVARRAGVTGWVRNRRDGAVEAQLEGRSGAVATVLAWMRAGGPEAARVDDLDVRPTDPSDARDFRVLRG